ncbi:MAG: lipocalin family protein [Phycisphaerae bacterium]|nr:lipocalin family protein [Phycisphaerae bacterium]
MTIKHPLALALALALQAGLVSPPAHAAADALQPIAALDVPRYMGTWHEIARFPNWFQKKCASDTRADYRLLPNGRIQVINRCREADGSLSEAVGEARQLGAADSPRLEVRFAPAWLSFLPMVWGDYWVIDLDPEYRLVAVSEPSREYLLDPEYRLVAVSEPSREYLWVLSRTPEVDAQAYQRLVERLAARGFEVGKLERSGLAPR